MAAIPFKLFSFFIVSLALAVSVEAKEEIRFGVFAYLGKEQTREKYQPLVDYLNRTLDKKVVMEVLTQKEMNARIASAQLDIATTNPTHFLVIRHQYPLSGAIATLISLSEGVPTSKLGGVIVVRDDSPVRTLRDIAGKTIATPSTRHMGGFRAQAYELHEAGVDLSKNGVTIIETFGSHQEVVHDVIDRKADVGFIRDGILEGMLQKGELKAGTIRILNEQTASSHPNRVSTRLYPEWPVFALPHADRDDVKMFLAALLSLQPSDEAIKKSGIYGYTLPADYLAVERLSRHLRLPPFDKAEEITYRDIWEQYRSVIIAMLAALAIAILYHGREERQKKLFQSLLSNIGDGVYGVDREGRCIWINPQALRMLGYSEKEVLYRDQHALFHHHKPSHEPYEECECPIHLTLRDHQIRYADENFIRKDGTFFPISLTVAPINHEGAIVVFRDVSEEKRTQDALRKSETGLKKAQKMARIGSWEFDLRANHLEWSEEIFRIFEIDPGRFGASYEAFLESVHPDERDRVDRAYRDSLETRKKYTMEHRLLMNDGRIKWVREVGDNEYDDEGTPVLSHGTVQDITEQYLSSLELQETKAKLEEANSALVIQNGMLQELAMVDALTRIPNRRYFDEMYDRKYKETLRDKKTLAVVMIDVDFFKSYNDHYGHPKGDECLVSIAEALKKTLKRPTDMVARYGGEEFVVLLKNSDQNGVEKVARMLVDAVSSMRIPHEHSAIADHVTISAGVAFKEAENPLSREELLRHADEALYRAKESGRNRFCFAGTSQNRIAALRSQ